MGRLPPAVTPAEARMGAVLMALLAALAVVVAGAVYRTAHDVALSALFLLLAALGAWQVAYYRRMEKQ